jgi:HPt (histidine-containing phosphotransfer) domain-containing protein
VRDVELDYQDLRSALTAQLSLGSRPTSPVLDANIVTGLGAVGHAVGEDLMGQLATLFLADADARAGALRQALADDNADELARLAHSMTGASANIGATDLASLCTTLAADVAACDQPGRGAILDAFDTELGRVRGALAPLALAP